MTDAEILSTDPYWWSTSPVSDFPTQSLPEDLDLLVNMNDEDISKISKNEMSFENKKILKLLIDFK